tara:strand:- start:127 stop:750 length:624 start_codon:yes stop_codon:yes gene_type:complete
MPQDLTSNYKVAFNTSLGFGERSALILVDFVQAYFDKACPLYADIEVALESAIKIRNVAREKNIPIIYTNVVYDHKGKNGGVFFKKAPVLKNFIEGNPMGAWPDKLQPLESEIIISKQYPSAFFNTPLTKILKQHNIDTLIITGVTTSGCIRATCIDAVSHGLIPIIVNDACGDRHEGPHQANLFDMNAKYGDVVSEKIVIDHLNLK